jgi:hypothetical protein
MRIVLALLVLIGCAGGSPGKPSGPAEWTPSAWTEESTVDLRTTDPGEQPHWSPVWLVVLDGQLYVRLGSRAAGRFDRNTTKPLMGVRIAGREFDRVHGVAAPDMKAKVEKAMADKYWLQGDVIVRHMDHPYTMRLEPAVDGATPTP